MTTPIDAPTLKSWLGDGHEIALLDVSEHGQYGSGHPFFAAPLPYSRFERDLPALVPNPDVRLVLCDEGDGIAARAGARAEAFGYRNLHILRGGKAAWRNAGYTLYAGVNVPSKAFGELVAHARHTPQLSAQQLRAMQDAGANMAVVDGRPFAEYRKMSIPGAICCPNGELPLRIADIVPDSSTTIVVNCAGRTRSIIGAQTLRELGLPNPVHALENGTQGWFLAGLELEHNASRRYVEHVLADPAPLRDRARQFAHARGVAYEAPATVLSSLDANTRTTYLLDVRTAEEHAALAVTGFVHAPGGQLIQATDQWIAVKGARLVLADAEMVRAPVAAGWLRQLGHDACVIDGGIKAAAALSWTRPVAPPALPVLPPVTPYDLGTLLAGDGAWLLDLRPAMSFRQAHIAQARWSIRPRVAAAARVARLTVLIADQAGVAALAALDLHEAGCTDVRLLAGGLDSWREAGLSIVATPDDPPDADCIDHLFFAHRRHQGDAEAVRQYLAWETGLLGQLDAQERGAFAIATDL